jgi:anti-sigma B factor antagonist
MQSGKIDTEIRTLNDSIGVIDIAGEVTGFAADKLNQTYEQVVASGYQKILLNFEKMDYLNSSGIGVLVTLFVRASDDGKDMVVAGLRSHFRRIFNLTRLQEVVPVFDDESDAVEHFAS